MNSRLRPVIVGIGGCSGSGKTTLACELARELGATLFPLDHYYCDLSQLPLDPRHMRNFDHPESFESELFIRHVRTLAGGLAVDRHVYDFRTHARVSGRFERIEPGGAVVVEGILALHYPELLPFYSLAIYVDAPHEVCAARRIKRDMHERGRTEKSVREQIEAAVRPMAEQYIIPSSRHAEMMVDGTEVIDRSVEQILLRLRASGLVVRDKSSNAV